jgi:hypothetical protein
VHPGHAGKASSTQVLLRCAPGVCELRFGTRCRANNCFGFRLQEGKEGGADELSLLLVVGELHGHRPCRIETAILPPPMFCHFGIFGDRSRVSRFHFGTSPVSFPDSSQIVPEETDNTIAIDDSWVFALPRRNPQDHREARNHGSSIYAPWAVPGGRTPVIGDLARAVSGFPEAPDLQLLDHWEATHGHSFLK